MGELPSLRSQVKALKTQDKIGEQNFGEVTKKIFEPVTKRITDVSQDVTGTMTETSKEKNKYLAILDVKFSEMLNRKSIKTTR